jgi:hypothetical protein
MEIRTRHLPKETIARINAALTDKTTVANDVIFEITDQFSSEILIDIIVRGNGKSPYIDPILYDREGNEIAVGQPGSDRIDTKFQWTVDGKLYEFSIESKELMAA